MGTLSKALASVGGFIAGPAVVIDFLRYCSRSFVFSAAGAPAVVAAGLAALRVLRREPQRVEATRGNARYLADGLRSLGFSCGDGEIPIIAVKTANALEGITMHCALLQAGVLTNMVLYPAVPRGDAMLRVSVMATHTRAQLDRGLAIFESIGRKVGGMIEARPSAEQLASKNRFPQRARGPPPQSKWECAILQRFELLRRCATA